MISDNIKLLCLIAFSITVSSCGGGSNDGSGTIDPQTISDEAINTPVTTATTTTATTEATAAISTSNGIATPVPAVSSLQMDEFIYNPLLGEIPVELNGTTPTVAPSISISNPLVY